MGLDATVYCNCFEVGRLREPPAAAWSVYVTDDGSLACQSDELEVLLAFDGWQRDRACEHPGGMLIHHRIGNMALVGFLRDELEKEAGSFPILLEKVLYSGSHGGDYLTLEDVSGLQKEVGRLAEFSWDDPNDKDYVDEFRHKMEDLIRGALSVGKPISF